MVNRTYLFISIPSRNCCKKYKMHKLIRTKRMRGDSSRKEISPKFS